MMLLVVAQALTSAHAAPRASAGQSMSSAAGMSWFLVSFELGPWDDYLLHELTPNLERLTVHPIPRVSWLALDDTLIAPDFADALMQTDRLPMMFSVSRSQSGLTMQNDPRGFTPEGSRFEQSLLMPGVTPSPE